MISEFRHVLSFAAPASNMRFGPQRDTVISRIVVERNDTDLTVLERVQLVIFGYTGERVLEAPLRSLYIDPVLARPFKLVEAGNAEARIECPNDTRELVKWPLTVHLNGIQGVDERAEQRRRTFRPRSDLPDW